MNLEQLQRKILVIARRNAPSDRVPYAFEQRIMARISSGAVKCESIWIHALRRAAASCVVVAALCSAWSFSPLGQPAARDSAEDFSQAFENTLLAPVNQHG